MENYFFNEDTLKEEDFLYFLYQWYNYLNDNSHFIFENMPVNYQALDELMWWDESFQNNTNNIYREILDLHGEHYDWDYNSTYNMIDFFNWISKWDTWLSTWITFELPWEIFSSLLLLWEEQYDNFEEYIELLSEKHNINNTYLYDDILYRIYITPETKELYNTKDKFDTLIKKILCDEEAYLNIDDYWEIYIHKDTIFYGTPSILLTVWAFLYILLNTEESFPYIHGQNLINYFENLYKVYTWKDINIIKKFNAEVNNFAKRQTAQLFIESLILNKEFFYDWTTYYKMKKNILPDNYLKLPRKQIERIKRTELFNILTDNKLIEKYAFEWEDNYMINLSMPNAVIPLDYIEHIKQLQEYYYLWDADEEYYETSIRFLEEYNTKSAIYKTEDLYIKVDEEIIEYLEKVNIYDFSTTVVVEMDSLPEFMVMWVNPQASCQSIIYNTWYNHQILGHIHNPLTKILLEFNKPDNVKDIDLVKRQFILENGETRDMYDSIRSRNVLVLTDWEGIKLQWFYGSPSDDVNTKLEDIIIDKYAELSDKYSHLHKVYEDELWDNNYYAEWEIIIRNEKE